MARILCSFGVVSAVLVFAIAYWWARDARTDPRNAVAPGPAAHSVRTARSEPQLVAPPTLRVAAASPDDHDSRSGSDIAVVSTFEDRMQAKYSGLDANAIEAARRELKSAVDSRGRAVLLEKEKNGEVDQIETRIGERIRLGQKPGKDAPALMGHAKGRSGSNTVAVASVHAGDDAELDALLDELRWLQQHGGSSDGH